MSDTETILIRVLAAADAVRMPNRDWQGHTSQNRHAAKLLAGTPYRVNAGRDEANRKAGERQIMAAQEAGLLAVGRGTRVKFPLVSLTAKGEAIARAVVGLPGRKEARVLLAQIAKLAERSEVYDDGHRWVAEDRANGGRGWGSDATDDDRAMLATIELEFVAAASLGWLAVGSSTAGHAAYRVTAAGRAELARASRAPSVGKLPAKDAAAPAMYRRELLARLKSLSQDVPARITDLGELPLSLAAFATIDDDDQDDE